MVGVVRPSLSWCCLLRKIALSRVGGVVWPTWANLSLIPRLITTLQPKLVWHFVASDYRYGLSFNFVDRDLSFPDNQFRNSLFSTRSFFH